MAWRQEHALYYHLSHAQCSLRFPYVHGAICDATSLSQLVGGAIGCC
jgi:hypothetical protein